MMQNDIRRTNSYKEGRRSQNAASFFVWLTYPGETVFRDLLGKAEETDQASAFQSP